MENNDNNKNPKVSEEQKIGFVLAIIIGTLIFAFIYATIFHSIMNYLIHIEIKYLICFITSLILSVIQMYKIIKTTYPGKTLDEICEMMDKEDK